MSGLGHTSLTHAACIATTAATAPITPDVPFSPVPRYNIFILVTKEKKFQMTRGLYEHLLVRANVSKFLAIQVMSLAIQGIRSRATR